MPSNNQTSNNPFHRPTQPKNSWELLKWLIFDYQLLEAYGKTLSQNNKGELYLDINFLIIYLNVIIYFIILSGIVIANLFNLLPNSIALQKTIMDAFENRFFHSKILNFILYSGIWFLLSMILSLLTVFLLREKLDLSRLLNLCLFPILLHSISLLFFFFYPPKVFTVQFLIAWLALIFSSNTAPCSAT